MSFKFNSSAGEERRYITKPGTYECVVASVKVDYLPPRADLYAKIALVNAEGESVFGDIFAKPDKDGGHYRLESFVASTATDAEKQELLAGGECDVDEAFLNMVTARTVGRRLKVKVVERKYLKKDGPEGVAYSGSSFIRLPDGPTAGNPF